VNELIGQTGPAASRWLVVAATGHRPHLLPKGSRSWVERELRRVAVKLRDSHGMRTGISGGAMGCDLWWADSVLEAGADLWVYRPFPQQPDRWNRDWREHHERVLARAARVVTLGAEPRVALLHARNAAMVRDADALVAVLDPAVRAGGTHATSALALGRLPVIRIDPRGRRVTLVSLEPSNDGRRRKAEPAKRSAAPPGR
jgi:hypothetical protein